VPDSATVCGLPPPLSASDKDAVRVPVADGVNVTLKVHVPLGATLPAQLFVWAKSVELVPVKLTFEITTVPVVLTLVRVNVCGLLVVPTVCAANVRLVGESDTAVPIPLKVTVCGLLVALSVMVTAAVRVLMVVGLKVTLIEQLAPAASDVPQLLVSEKSFVFVPVMAMLVIVTTTVEEGLVTVMI